MPVLASTLIIPALYFIVGVLFGSFGNVLIYRLPEGIMPTGRSYCRHCKHKLGFFDLFPVLSFAFRLGRCAYCKHRISWQYPIIELLSGLLFLLALYVTGNNLLNAFLLALCLWLLLLISTIDFKIQGIPDVLSFPFIVLSIAYGVVSGIIDPFSIALGIAFLGGQWLMSKGMWVGSGDIILITGIGALVGAWPMMVVCMFGAYILGAIYASILLIQHRDKATKTLAFGPFLSLALVLTLLFGERLLNDVYGVYL